MIEENGLDQLKRDLKLNTPARFYIFHGEEAYLRAYYLEQLHKLLVEDFAEAFNYHRINSDNLSYERVAQSINSPPMMAQTSMVQIDDVNFFAQSEDAERYAKLFADIPETCTVVLVFDTLEFKIDKRRKALAAVFEQAVNVEFTHPKERELTVWIGRHLRKYQKQITTNDAVYLIHRTGGAMTTLLAEIGKLGAYVEESTVTRADIDLLVEPVLEAVTFEIADAISEGRSETALEKLYVLLKRDDDNQSKVFGAISTQMRRILTAKRLISAGKNQQDLMRLCGIQNYPAQKTMGYARRLSDRFCEKSVLLCLEADTQLKTSFDKPERILELLVLRLAEEARRG